jgi:hypothetical protein
VRAHNADAVVPAAAQRKHRKQKMQFDALGAHVHTRTRLLGVIAGLFTVVAAQAAELPVKTKAVQYVKICTLYGAGFYYIPDTQTCMKIGGCTERFAPIFSPVGNTPAMMPRHSAFPEPRFQPPAERRCRE